MVWKNIKDSDYTLSHHDLDFHFYQSIKSNALEMFQHAFIVVILLPVYCLCEEERKNNLPGILIISI